MKKPRITFFCTGMCSEDHPVHKHCKECSHALFAMKLGSLKVYYAPLFGSSFYEAGKIYYPPEDSYLWKVAEELRAFANRSFKRWGKKK